MAVTETYPIRKDLFKLGSWILSQYDNGKGFIVHNCRKQKTGPGFVVWWSKYICTACGERIPDELQTIYILYKAGQ